MPGAEGKALVPRLPGASGISPSRQRSDPKPRQQHPGSHSFTSVYSMDLDATGLEQDQKSAFLFFGSTLT